MNHKDKNIKNETDETELNNLKLELKIRGLETRFFAEFYCLKRGRQEEEILKIIHKVHQNLTEEYIEETKQILLNHNFKFIEKIKWYVGRLFRKEFDSLMYLLREYDQTNGSYLLEHSDEIQMDKINIIRCKEIFGITDKDKEVQQLEDQIYKLDLELKKRETMIDQLQWKLDESTQRENNLKKENETIQNEIKNNKNIEEELQRLKKEYQVKMNEINELKHLKHKFEELKKQNEELQNENKCFKANVNEMNKKVKEYEENEMKLKEQISKQEEETNKYKTKTKRYYLYSKQKEDEVKQLKNQLTGKIYEKPNETTVDSTQTTKTKPKTKNTECRGKLKEVIKKYESMTLDPDQIQKIKKTNESRKLRETQSVYSQSENSMDELNTPKSEVPFISSHTSNPALKRTESIDRLRRLSPNKPEQFESRMERNSIGNEKKEIKEKKERASFKQNINLSSMNQENQLKINNHSDVIESPKITQPMIKKSHHKHHTTENEQNENDRKEMKSSKSKHHNENEENEPKEMNQLINENEVKPFVTIDDIYQSNLSETIRSRREMFEQMTNNQNPNQTQTPRLTIRKSSNPNLRAWKLFDK